MKINEYFKKMKIGSALKSNGGHRLWTQYVSKLTELISIRSSHWIHSPKNLFCRKSLSPSCFNREEEEREEEEEEEALWYQPKLVKLRKF